MNPDAPKGGEVAVSNVGTFDSFNPFIVRGTAASDVFRVWDTLMMPNIGEAETEYCLLANVIELPADQWVSLELNPRRSSTTAHRSRPRTSPGPSKPCLKKAAPSTGSTMAT